MTCKHGFIGACAECDGAGQIPEEQEERPHQCVYAPLDDTCIHCGATLPRRSGKRAYHGGLIR